MPVKSNKDFAKKIIDILKKEYPKVKSALEYSNPFELLISTILSAQCTDERVNLVTKELFKKYKKPQDFVNLSNAELEKEIFSTGFYKQKAKSIKACCQRVNIIITKVKYLLILMNLLNYPELEEKLPQLLLVMHSEFRLLLLILM